VPGRLVRGTWVDDVVHVFLNIEGRKWSVHLLGPKVRFALLTGNRLFACNKSLWNCCGCQSTIAFPFGDEALTVEIPLWTLVRRACEFPTPMAWKNNIRSSNRPCYTISQLLLGY